MRGNAKIAPHTSVERMNHLVCMRNRTAFRSEMRQARDQGQRMQKFVPSSKIIEAERSAMEQRANSIFGVGANVFGTSAADESLKMSEEFDEWPGAHLNSFRDGSIVSLCK